MEDRFDPYKKRIEQGEDLYTVLASMPKRCFGQPIFIYLLGVQDPRKGSLYEVTDRITIPAHTEPWNNPQPIHTSLGIYLVNRSLLNDKNAKLVGFVNKRMDSDVLEDIESKITESYKGNPNDRDVNSKDVTVYDFMDWLQSYQTFGFALTDVFCASLTPETVVMNKDIRREKTRLIKEIKNSGKDINDPAVASDMSNKLIDYARKSIGEDNVGFELYESGSKASFGNNFKALFLMKGPMYNYETGKYETSTNCYADGTSKNDMPLIAGSAISSAYAKGVGTQKGGHQTKQFTATMQSVVTGDDEFCGTKYQMKIMITKFNKGMMVGSYINDKGKVVLLTNENIGQYVGTKVNAYDPCCCIGEHICKRCSGKLYNDLGIKNIGLTTTKYSSKIMNASLKKMHDTSIKIFKITNIDDFIIA